MGDNRDNRDNLTVKTVIKLVITRICTQMNLNEGTQMNLNEGTQMNFNEGTQMNLNENDNEDIIEQISNDLSPEERTFFEDLTDDLNSHRRRDDYSIQNAILDGGEFSANLTTKIKEYIAKKRNYDPTNVYIMGGSFT
ncbi:14567_t:CDS:1 [Racocetra persica]|uniref:14567_t:CDS:1 n=1 Tax=Racocetra persica TaxID=160502 RepID=A0ACA9N8T5_9GLOM|nr:14567_t:CDS:1 [Racocetra persica]